MKVICINNGPVGKTYTTCGKTGVYVPRLTEGDIYTVIDQMSWKGSVNYKLMEIPDEGRVEFWYNALLFVPLSSIDETELAAAREGVEA